MFRHLITSINYKKLIEEQANKAFDLDKTQSRKNNSKIQDKSKVMVKKMKPISK